MWNALYASKVWSRFIRIVAKLFEKRTNLGKSVLKVPNTGMLSFDTRT